MGTLKGTSAAHYVLATRLTNDYTDLGNPVQRLANFVTRSWDDRAGRGINNDYVPQCDLLSPLANGECGALSDANFGKPVQSTASDPAVLRGWGVRPDNWEFSMGVQHELIPRVGVSVGYFNRRYGNFTLTDNRAVATSDYSPFTIRAPLDPRLPGGGGYVISGPFNLNPNKVGQVDNYYTLATNFGNQLEHWNGVDASVNLRFNGNLLVQGGLSTGKTTTDNCDVVTKVDNPSPLYCHVETRFLTQVKFLGTYTVPKADVQIAATFRSLAGPQILANYAAPNALVQPSLGRPLSSGAANVTVNLVEPGTMYGDRSNQLDLRFSKILRFGRTRTAANLYLYNALNASPVLTQNNNYATWQAPQSILLARFAKLSVQFDF